MSELNLHEIAQDIKVSFRSLRRVPVLTLTIVATVGLGIGATVTIFSAVNAALLRPLPYAAPERLVRIYTDAPPYQFRFSLADYLALREQQTQFEEIAAYTGRAMAFSDGTTAERVLGRVISPTYFSLLGIRPAMGRDFTAADGRLRGRVFRDATDVEPAVPDRCRRRRHLCRRRPVPVRRGAARVFRTRQTRRGVRPGGGPEKRMMES